MSLIEADRRKRKATSKNERPKQMICHVGFEGEKYYVINYEIHRALDGSKDISCGRESLLPFLVQ